MDLYEMKQALNTGKTIWDLPLRVTYYARVSTEKDEQLHSLSAQVQYYSQFIKACPNWIFVDGYIDEGISGTSVQKRENFLRMIEDAKAGKFDFIVTKEISRFSRNTLDSIQFTQELLRCGVGVLFQSDNINTLLPDSELRLTIMASIAQDEVRKISERVKFGFKRAIEKGTVLGNNRIWGYQKQNGRLVVDPEEAQVVRLIFELYANQRMGIRTISRYLADYGYENSVGNAFSFSTIRGILSNPKYKGFYCGRKSSKIDYKLSTIKTFPPDEWIIYRDEENVPPIVSEELWEKANRILAKRSAKQSAEDKTSYQNKYPYSGKIRCGVHHQTYYRSVYRYKSGDKEVWQCQEYTRKGKQGCRSPMIYTSELDEIMRRSLEEVTIQKEEIVRELLSIYCSLEGGSKTEQAIAKGRGRREEILRRKDKLLDLSVDGRVSDHEFSVRNDRFNRELEKLEGQLQALEEKRRKSQEMLGSMEKLQQAIRKELNFEDGFSDGVIDALLDHVEINGTQDQKVVQAMVYLRAIPEPRSYTVQRIRGNTSVCTRQYT